MDADCSADNMPPSADTTKDSYSGNEGGGRSIYRARACLRCSRSKLRCMRTADPSVKPCVRCARLGAECTIPEAKPRGPRRGQGRRVGQLEQKLDGIMSLLTAGKHILSEQQQSTPPTSVSLLEEHRTDPFGKIITTGPGLGSCTSSYANTVQDYLSAATPDSLPRGTDPSPKATPPERSSAAALDVSPGFLDPEPQQYDIFPGLELSSHEARAVLSSYRNIYLPNFPFVPIPKSTTPGALFAKKPLLFRTIMLACAPQSLKLQRDGDRWFRSQIAQRVVVNGEKNLELLQSIILFVAWCDYNLLIYSKGTSLLQIALGIVMDLSLNKPPTMSYAQKYYAVVTEAFKTVPFAGNRSSYCREDMRAMLGAFYCTTVATTLFRREYHLPYTEFIDRCCAELLEAEEHPNDKILVAMIKMQCLVRRAHAYLPGAYPGSDLQVMFTPSAAVGLAAIRREMEEMAANFSTLDKATNHLFRLHYYGAMIAIHEPVNYTRSMPPSAAPSLPSGPALSQGLNRVDALWQTLRAATDYLDTYLEMPTEVLGLQPFPHTAHLSFGFVTATRMLFMQDMDWDTAAARRIFDFLSVTSRMADHYASAEAFETRDGPASSRQFLYRRRFQGSDRTGLLTSYVAKLLWLRQWYMARTAPPGHNVSLPGEDPLISVDGYKQPDRDDLEGDGEQRALQPDQAEQQHQPQHQPQRGVSIPSDLAPGPGFDAQNMDPMAGFDPSYLDTFDDSFWFAFMMDPQMAVPPAQLDPAA